MLILKGTDSVPDVLVHILTTGLSGITVEVGSRDDCFLTDVYHLMLEVRSNGQVMDKVNLLSRESMPGVWDADNIVSL
jgi:hypothetical protein